ncbi:SWI/SNF-related matrix-associated actin-dependent regulator of chromatin subfamily A containing DEAD/H box 1 homolog [Anabrus simplex]|uniref:SWI/SNF-related matrix-associated actin-dependent regulator of chromatin subfamily A containing DEAD/H box 1 homolog n=1 Tax=Anabrus simplex TaxID=316456 RepID=UPI0035A2F8C5
MSQGENSSMSNSKLSEQLRRFRFSKQPVPKLVSDSNSPLSNDTFNGSSHFKENVIEVIELSDSEDSSSNPSKSISTLANGRQTTAEDEDLNSKEASLGTLEDLFPEIDKMELQDELMRNNWDVNKTESHLNSKVVLKRSLEEDPEEVIRPHKVRRNAVESSDEEKSEEEDANVPDERVYDSEDSDEEVVDDLAGEKQKVFDFLSTATAVELTSVSTFSQKKADVIIEQRPFSGWKHLVDVLSQNKYLGTNLLNATQDYLQMRDEINSLMKKCLKLATEMEQEIVTGAASIKEQPSLLSKGYSLTGYQMVGLNWLYAMHKKQLNGILADEMGLGKTIQVIALLAHLKEITFVEEPLLHLIVVPSSTLDNWKMEFQRWCPALQIVQYYGSPQERKALRVKWVKHGIEDVDVILTTYSILNGSPEEKKMFCLLPLEYLVLDEAHMLKNMTSQRHENLSRINAAHRILLTGTPLQNNLLELMSLLSFLMPKMFRGKREHLRTLFSKFPKEISLETNESKLPKFEQQQIALARRIMKPFVLRRLKSEVLQDLPTKTVETVLCDLAEEQKEKYDELVAIFSKSDGEKNYEHSAMTVMMKLRKMANHPLLLRYYYTDQMIEKMAEYLAKNPLYKENNPEIVLENLSFLSDFELYKLTKTYEALSEYTLPDKLFLESGKVKKLDELLPDLKCNNHRVLIFSQFICILDILEVYLTLRGHKFLRFDGSTPVTSRQELIDSYNEDESIFVFLLSTRAGGMGINLTAADTVIVHDIDFNPYNDKQAEDRCHRVGQSRNVTVLKLLSAGTVEEGINRVAQGKLSLEKEITSSEGNSEAEASDVVGLLQQVLGLDSGRGTFLNVQQDAT